VKIAQKGVTYRGLKYTEGPGEESGKAAEKANEARERFVMADSEALLHHASETLLRLYLAHEQQGDCPWLDMARVRSPGKFKQMVDARFLAGLPAEERLAGVGNVFFGVHERTKLSPTPPERQWTAGLSNIEAFLTHFRAPLHGRERLQRPQAWPRGEAWRIGRAARRG
jgi:hypothetical protein